MASQEIPKQIIASMVGQVDVLFTLSVAICGGIIALIFQISLHNTTANKTVLEMKGKRLLFLSLFTEGASIVLGYFAHGSIIANTPSIYKMDFAKIDHWGSVASFEGFGTLVCLMQAQFVAFGVGFLFLFIVVLLNKKLM
jgi:hypothetical protein